LKEVTDFQKVVFMRILLEVGKIYKSQAGGSATISELTSIGATKWDESAFADMDEELVFNYQKYVWKRVINTGRCPYIFFADATASGLQVLSLLLGAKDEKVERVLNLKSGDVWYDTYTSIVNDFLRKNHVEPSVAKFFVRKHLKKTIMILNYSGTLHRCYEGFLKSINGAFSKEERDLLFKEHRAFYKHVLEIFDGDSFFKKSSKILVQALGGGAKNHLSSWEKSSSDDRRQMFSKITEDGLLTKNIAQELTWVEPDQRI
jgi:hypothetical protein